MFIEGSAGQRICFIGRGQMFGWAEEFEEICRRYLVERTRLGESATDVWLSGGVWGNLHLFFGWADAFGIICN